MLCMYSIVSLHMNGLFNTGLIKDLDLIMHDYIGESPSSPYYNMVNNQQ